MGNLCKTRYIIIIFFCFHLKNVNYTNYEIAKCTLSAFNRELNANFVSFLFHFLRKFYNWKYGCGTEQDLIAIDFYYDRFICSKKNVSTYCNYWTSRSIEKIWTLSAFGWRKKIVSAFSSGIFLIFSWYFLCNTY